MKSELSYDLAFNLQESLGGSALKRKVREFAYSNWRADEYRVDGVTGKVAAWKELSKSPTGIKSITPAHEMAQALSANQCAIPVKSALFNQRLAATYVDQNYISTAPPSAWRIFHEGTGFMLYNVLSFDDLTGTKHVINTSVGGANVGFTFTSSALLLAASINSAAGAIAFPASSGNALATGTPYITRFSYAEGITPKEASLYLGKTLQGEVDTSSAPAVGVDPTNTLRFGNRTSGSPFIGKWCETVIVKGVSAYRDALVKKYLAEEYALVA